MSKPAARSLERLPLKVLIIDDSESERAELRRILSADGMKTFELPSAIGATREALQQGVDAAVIDAGTSDHSSERLVSLLRENRRLARLLIVVLSGRPESELAGLRATADAIIPKERMRSELSSTLRRLQSAARTSHPTQAELDG